jgi:hypothetical protein
MSHRFDQASLTILDRINYAVQILEHNSTLLAPLHQVPNSTNVLQQSELCLQSPDSLPVLNTDDVFINNATTLEELLQVNTQSTGVPILSWPIFENKVNPHNITTAFYGPENGNGVSPPDLRSTLPNHHDSRARSITGAGIREENVLALIREFLEKVHIKNPILDADHLTDLARDVAENGFKWDTASCLVMIACALASLAKPFELEKPRPGEVSTHDALDYPTAEAYYTGARKRIGLLESSIMSAQCEFLIGVYEMYSIRPLKAWLSFNRACLILQTCLQARSGTMLSRSQKRLEQRLYWTCLKSECEMRDEIELPPTGLAKIDYPDIFPSPPGGTPEPQDNSQLTPHSSLDATSQHSWYYYLAEIASRRLLNRITYTLYGAGPMHWMSTPIHKLIRLANELDAQVQQWSEHLPISMNALGKTSDDELAFMLRGRYFEMKERIRTPFLYMAIHMSQTNVQDLEAAVLVRAHECIDTALEYIEHLGIKHRHHGSWYVARQLFSKGLLVLAAVKSATVTIDPTWLGPVLEVEAHLKYWEGEAPDLHAARLAFHEIFEGLESPVAG